MTNSKKEPVLTDFLYRYNSIHDVVENYILALEDFGTLESRLHAIKLKEFNDVTSNRNFFSKLRKNFNSIFSMVRKDFPSLQFYIEGRRKSLISSEKKISLYIKDGRSLDDLRDLSAFRLILIEENSIELVESCYVLMERIIAFLISQGLIPCEATPVTETEGFTSDNTIIVPSKSLLSNKGFENNVKDYIRYPKINGYQSLHCSFRDPSGKCFEIQIRTFAMHELAESGTANHSSYKKQRYSNEITIEREQVKIPGYSFVAGTLFDFVGLENSLQILQRTTF